MIENRRPRAFWPGGGERRRYDSPASDMPGGTMPVAGASGCPPVILDSSPDGSGLGIWIFVAAGDGYCEYEYGGGIA